MNRFSKFIVLTITILASFNVMFGANKTDSKGRRQGEWSSTYEKNGQIKYKGQFKNDIPYGTFYHYYENGALKCEQVYIDDNVSKVTIYESDGGTVTAKGQYYNKEKDGKWEYFSEGKITQEENYIKGVKNGIFITYSKEEVQIELIPYKDGKIDGICQYFLTDGKKHSIVTYSAGVMDGPYQLYEGNENPIIDGTFVNGKRDGDWNVYDETGKLIETLKYKNGVLKNQKEIDKKYSNEYDEIESKQGTIAEPTEEFDAPIGDVR